MAETKTETPKPDRHAAVLDLQTLITRPVITIDGRRYEILSPDELSVVQSQRYAAWGRRIDALMAKDTLEPAAADEMAGLLRTLTDEIMVRVPETVRDQLSDQHRLEVAEVFTMLPLKKKMARMAAAGIAGTTPGRKVRRAAAAKARRSTGASSPPGSSGSTAAIQAGG